MLVEFRRSTGSSQPPTCLLVVLLMGHGSALRLWKWSPNQVRDGRPFGNLNMYMLGCKSSAFLFHAVKRMCTPVSGIPRDLKL